MSRKKKAGRKFINLIESVSRFSARFAKFELCTHYIFLISFLTDINCKWFIISGVFIVGARRTAFGTFGGAFKNITATQLQVAAAQAALKDANLSPEKVDSVVIGHVMQSTQTDGIYLPRHVSLTLGIPIEKPALGINRLWIRVPIDCQRSARHHSRGRESFTYRWR